MTPYKVKLNKNGSYQYYTSDGVPISADGVVGEQSINKTLPEITVTASPTPPKVRPLINFNYYLQDLPEAYTTLYNNYTAKGLALPAEYTSFREVNDQIAKSIGDVALTYVGGKAAKPLLRVAKSAFPLLSKTINLKAIKAIPQRFKEGVGNFNISNALNDLIFNRLLSNPVSKVQLAGDIAAGSVMNHYANKPISNGKSAVDMLSDASHFNPSITSGILDLATGAAWEKTVSNRFRNVLKRGTEMAMRTSSVADPLPLIRLSNYFGNDHPKNIMNNIQYVLFGDDSGFINNYLIRRIPYKPLRGFNPVSDKHLAVPFETLKKTVYDNPEYTGVRYKNGFTLTGIDYDNYGDVIDAILYGKTLDPRIAHKSMLNNYGVHTSYIKEKYPHKDIPVYTSFDDRQFPSDYILANRFGYDSSMRMLNDNYIDTAGHIAEEYYRPTYDHRQILDKAIVEQDIFKFNPEEYTKKWDIQGIISRLGLNVVDDLTTPVIFRNLQFEKGY